MTASDTLYKTVNQYNKEPISAADMQRLTELAQDYCSVKNYVYQRYGGIGSLSKLYPGYTVQNEMTASGLRKQLGMPSVHFYCAVFDALGDIKSQWSHTKARVEKNIRENENMTPEDRHYLRFVMKQSQCLEAVLLEREPLLAENWRQPYEEVRATVQDEHRLQQYLRRQIRRQLKKMHTETADGFSVTQKGYRYADHGIYLSDICKVSDKPLVLMIDEIDSAANNQVFLDFLAQLRGYYIDRDRSAAFRSVILAGVYDIKNLKRMFRPKDQHKTNSPWNIAVDFKVDMSFSAKDIAGMLEEYEKDQSTGMNIEEMSELIYEHTSGYPFLVSKLCKLIDEEVAGQAAFPEKRQAWTYAGFTEADKILLREKNTLFESMINKLLDFPELKDIVYSILFTGKEISYNALDPALGIAEMFGFVKNVNGAVAIANRVFEMIFYNLFLTSAENQNTDIYKAAIRDKNRFVYAGHLNMELLLERFVEHFSDLYGDCTDRFKEEDGRRYFLLYLRPIINGTGNYYIESRTRNMERTDVIVDYHGEQIVVELKIWRGNAYKERGEKQLAGYLEHYHLKKGYMLSFDFNKKKETGVKRHVLGDKVLIEAVV